MPYLSREISPRLVADANALLGEGPLWDPERGVLWWVDIVARMIHCFDPVSGSDQALPAPCMVTALGLAGGGRLVACMEHAVALFSPRENLWAVLASPESGRPANRFNDAKVDPEGRFVAGTMSTLREEGTAALYAVSGRGGAPRLLEGLTIANGMGWDSTGESFYFIDSVQKVVRQFARVRETGALSKPKVVADATADADTRLLDGLCVDAEGMLWIAHFGAGRVVRWDPRTGRALQTVSVPAPRVTSCAFGGPRYETLFITTARSGLEAEQQEAWPLSGGLFAIEPGVGGLPSHRFKED